jgi:hypothetical protein
MADSGRVVSGERPGVAVTPNLHVGTTLPIPDYKYTVNPEAAAAYIREGETVLTPSWSAAYYALVFLGVTTVEARERIESVGGVL